MNLLKKLPFLAFALLFINFTNAQAKASPATVATGKINDANITINYSSPAVKGREIWGGLVPFDKVWRAGANDATTFETDKDLTVEGKTLPAGKYSLFIIPNEKECTIIFNKEAKQWGAYKYDATKDELRVTVKPQIEKSSTESLVYNVNKNSVDVVWEKWKIAFRVK